MTRQQLDALARRYLSTRFDEIESRLAVDTLEGRGAWRHARTDALEVQHSHAASHLAAGDFRLVSSTVAGMLPEADDETRAKLARRLLEGELEALTAEIRALYGEPLAFPSLASSNAAVEEPKVTPHLSEVLASYVAERTSQGKWNPKTKLQREIVGRVIVELLGDPRVGDVSKADMRTFGLTVPRLPSNVSKRYPGIPLAEVLKRAGDDPAVPRLQAKTVNLYLQLARTLFAWAVEHDKIATSPATILHDHDEGDPQDKRHPFDDADITAFIRYLGDSRDVPWHFWIPRILAYSGMRLSEVSQLRKCDVRQVDGVAVFDVNDADGRRIKNRASRRILPVHPRLVELGLLAFVAQQPDGFLWPAPPRVVDEVRNTSHNLSRNLNRWLDAAGVADPKKTAAHSFRHTVEQRLEDAEVPVHVIKAIVGHTDKDITTGVYGRRPKPAKMLDALCKLALPI